MSSLAKAPSPLPMRCILGRGMCELRGCVHVRSVPYHARASSLREVREGQQTDSKGNPGASFCCIQKRQVIRPWFCPPERNDFNDLFATLYWRFSSGENRYKDAESMGSLVSRAARMFGSDPSALPDNSSNIEFAGRDTCAGCGRVEGRLRKCSRCKNTVYCSAECQQGDCKFIRL